MTKSKGTGRGSNKNSHKARLIADKPTKEEDKITSRLLPHQRQIALELGSGNASDGIRKALNICSREYQIENPIRLVALLDMAQATSDPTTKSELIQEALDYLESWSVERSYSEGIAEGVIKTPSGAYII